MPQRNYLFEPCFGRIFQKKKKQPAVTLSILIFLLFVDKSQEHVTKNKIKKPKSVFFLSENFRQTAKGAKKYQEITKRDYKKDFKATFTGQSQKDHQKSFLGYGKKSFQR